MAKNSTKSSNKNVPTTTSADSVAPVAPPVEVKAVAEQVVSEPAPAKKTKKSKKDSVESASPVVAATAEVSPVPAVESTEVAAPAIESVVPPVVLADNSIVTLLAELASLDQQEVSIQQQRRIKRRLLEKAIGKVLKANNKATSKKQKRSGNRQPSGFIRPTLISDELASFLGKESGTELARTAVTNQINNYIKLNNLKDTKNGRQINADSKLATLLKLGKDDVLTYFNLQKYMKHHFVKKTPVESSPVVVV